MFETKKTLIVVYKDELLMNQLKKMVDTHDDNGEKIVGTRDDSINIVSWTEEVWNGNKKAGNIQGKILFLGNIKGMDKLKPVLDIKFNDFGVQYGWAGNQAALYADPKLLMNRQAYDEFLNQLSDLPVPEFLKTFKQNAVLTGMDSETEQLEVVLDIEAPSEDGKTAKIKAPKLLKVIQKAVENGVEAAEKFGGQVAVQAEEIFRNRSLMERQMLFYGVIHLYNEGLEKFMNA